jgi:uncharacterized PurR-regulated membrane protein YhhQ (DUF165 family)
VTRITRRYQWSRVLFSNAISIPLDNTLFVVLAFAGVLPLETIVVTSLSGAAFNVLSVAIGWPLIYLVPEREPRAVLPPA